MKTRFSSHGQTLISIIISVIIGLMISGLLYYFQEFQKQIPEVSKITEKETLGPEETITSLEEKKEEEKIEEKTTSSTEKITILPKTEKPIIQKCVDGDSSWSMLFK